MKKSDIISLKETNYELMESIGNGGSGIVWKVNSNRNDYALKVIDSKDANKITRFKKEIDFCKNINHKNIIKIIDDAEYNGKPFYVMPLNSPKVTKNRSLRNTQTTLFIII